MQQGDQISSDTSWAMSRARAAPGGAGPAQRRQAPTLQFLARRRVTSIGGVGGVRNVGPILLSSIRDFANASNAAHDPGRLQDTVIRQTSEYRTLVQTYCRPPWSFTKADAAMACRLAIRTLRQGGTAELSGHVQGEGLMRRAREQGAAARGVEGQVNSLEWVPFSSGLAARDPARLDSEFARWLLVASSAQPSSTSGKMNCWELLMYGAFRAGVMSEAQMRAVYARAIASVRSGACTRVGQTFEEATRASAPVRYQEGRADSPRPLRGDIVVFQSATVHACIATGNVVRNSATGAEECEVISLWTLNGRRVERTTIEALARSATDRPIRFWSSRWDGV